MTRRSYNSLSTGLVSANGKLHILNHIVVYPKCTNVFNMFRIKIDVINLYLQPEKHMPYTALKLFFLTRKIVMQ